MNLKQTLPNLMKKRFKRELHVTNFRGAIEIGMQFKWLYPDQPLHETLILNRMPSSMDVLLSTSEKRKKTKPPKRIQKPPSDRFYLDRLVSLGFVTTEEREWKPD